jgi:hypothetical protein
MNKFQKIGGVGAFFSAVYLAAYLLFTTKVFPDLGIAAGVSVFLKPGTEFPFTSGFSALFVFYLLDVVMAVSLALTTIALCLRLRDKVAILRRVVGISGGIGAVLFILTATIGFSTTTQLHRFASEYPDEFKATYLAIILVVGALQFGAVFAYSWWALLTGWVGLRSGILPKPLDFLGLTLGASGILTLILPLGLVTLGLGVIWSVGLGIMLIRG